MYLVKELYIDPGTGGMLFTVLFGIVSVAVFSLRALFLKLKFSSGGKGAKTNKKKIPIASMNLRSAIRKSYISHVPRMIPFSTRSMNISPENILEKETKLFRD